MFITKKNILKNDVIIRLVVSKIKIFLPPVYLGQDRVASFNLFFFFKFSKKNFLFVITVVIDVACLLSTKKNKFTFLFSIN